MMPELNRWLLILLVLAVLASALAVVAVKHDNRARVAYFEELRRERERLEVEWARLRIEEATLANHARIERVAREQLKMVEPRQPVIVPLEAPR